MELALELKPVSLIGFGDGAEVAAFTAMNPATGSPLEPKFFAASAEDLQRAAVLAQSAFPFTANFRARKRAPFCARLPLPLRRQRRPSSSEPIWKQRYPKRV